MLWDDFVNSDYHDWRGGNRSEDRLDKPGWLGQWLANHDLPDPGPPSPRDIGELKRLRTSLLRIVRELVAGDALSPADVGELNRILAEGPVVQQLTAGEEGFRLEPASIRDNWAGIRARIAASFCGMLADGETSRLRICDNPDCLWVYYDETRNRSKRFCDDRMCGNLIKVRRFRERRKAGPATTRSNKN